ncbi:peptidoglycan editing factor PgeF [Limnohabitans sp. G3-2]|uniref:peptidoglycan editing factor PgeF n=1 Tax=Limnohabitans sp. G3-2 TaxID=1100711 RepID=UPI000C1E81C3|nr:peptidoglycan editing factor PgeF [Limnohabitans sp. G3-2]PIT77932.1 laccase [Limnohabitans sp. G3-2]
MTSLADLGWLADWPAPAHVRTLMTDRRGGVSAPPWDSMNLGDHVGDALAHVQSNRALLQSAVGAPLIFLKQVHGQTVAHLDAHSRSGTEADACIATGPQAACTIMVADCLPVLMCDTQGQWVAAAHAGWRGLAGQAGEGVLESLRSTSPVEQTRSEDILVWLGPCIGPQAFEVGDEVRAAFCQHNAAPQALFKPLSPGKWLADLAGLARWRLRQLGIDKIYGNDGHPDWCTVSNSVRFFSHRRDSPTLGQSGRMAACIWLSS